MFIAERFRNHDVAEKLIAAEKDLDKLRRDNNDLEKQCRDMKDIVQTQMNHLNFYKQHFSSTQYVPPYMFSS